MATGTVKWFNVTKVTGSSLPMMEAQTLLFISSLEKAGIQRLDEGQRLAMS